LLVPYLLWTSLYVAVILAMKLAGVVLKGKPLSGITDWLSEQGGLNIYWSCQHWGSCTTWLGQVIEPTNSAPYLVPMWFMRDLMVVSLLSPLIHWLLRRCGTCYMAALLLAYLSKVWIYLPGLSSTAFLFFSAGAWFAIRGRNMMEDFLRVRIPVYIAYLLLLVPSVYFDGPYTPVGNYLYPFFVILGVAAYVCLAADAMKRGWLRPHKGLSQSAFFVYGLHTIFVLGVSSSLLRKLLPWDCWWVASVRYLLVPIVCVAACYVAYKAMMRWMPRVGKWLTGGR
jgi:peptidoglycan/LPS O-acetylase OafA/YrhL